MRFIICLPALAVVAACSAQVPDSGAGVGFSDYNQYIADKRKRDAQLAGGGVASGGAISDETSVAATTVAPSGATESEELAAEARATLARTQANSGQTPVEASPANPPPQTVTGAGGISSENDFEAVGNVRSIETDAELIAQNRAQYKVIQPTALPSRSGSGGPNIVQYALNTKHPVGTRVYTRAGLNKDARYQRNCARYASPDRAQEDFLANGGPNRDKYGLDPDGDGFACAWDPTPFRKAVRG